MTNENKKPTSIVITALICITVLECWAMYQGMNGALFGLALVAIGGLAGYLFPSPLKK